MGYYGKSYASKHTPITLSFSEVKALITEQVSQASEVIQSLNSCEWIPGRERQNDVILIDLEDFDCVLRCVNPSQQDHVIRLAYQELKELFPDNSFTLSYHYIHGNPIRLVAYPNVTQALINQLSGY